MMSTVLSAAEIVKRSGLLARINNEVGTRLSVMEANMLSAWASGEHATPHTLVAGFVDAAIKATDLAAGELRQLQGLANAGVINQGVGQSVPVNGEGTSTEVLTSTGEVGAPTGDTPPVTPAITEPTPVVEAPANMAVEAAALAAGPAV